MPVTDPSVFRTHTVSHGIGAQSHVLIDQRVNGCLLASLHNATKSALKTQPLIWLLVVGRKSSVCTGIWFLAGVTEP